jgi:hypothetical protein
MMGRKPRYHLKPLGRKRDNETNACKSFLVISVLKKKIEL